MIVRVLDLIKSRRAFIPRHTLLDREIIIWDEYTDCPLTVTSVVVDGKVTMIYVNTD